MMIQMCYNFSQAKCYGLEIKVRQHVISTYLLGTALYEAISTTLQISLVNFEASLFMPYYFM